MNQNSAMLGGLQLAWIIKDWYALNDIEEAILDYEDLLAVELVKDNLEGFLHKLETTLAGMKNHPEPELLESILVRNLEIS